VYPKYFRLVVRLMCVSQCVGGSLR